MITESQRTELSEALYNALLRRLKGETDEDRALKERAWRERKSFNAMVVELVIKALG